MNDQTVEAPAPDPRPDTILLMELLAEAETEAHARTTLDRRVASLLSAGDAASAARWRRVAELWAAHPGAWSVVRSTLAVAAHDRTETTPDDALRHWAGVFDQLAAASPAAGVALYSLGSETLLAEASREVVAYLGDLGLLGPDRAVLDLGCGIGRLTDGVAPHVHHVLGVDIAAGMVAEAQRRCGHHPNVRFLQVSGTDLTFLPDRSIDLVVAADVFPYLVQAGGGLVERLIREIARVLRPGGAAAILNLSYRNDLERDRLDLAAAAATVDLRILKNGEADLRCWDARTFLLAREPQPAS